MSSSTAKMVPVVSRQEDMQMATPMDGIEHFDMPSSHLNDSGNGIILDVDIPVAQLNNTGVSLLEQQGNRTEAAKNFLRALWQLEQQQQQQHSSSTTGTTAIISSSHLLSSSPSKHQQLMADSADHADAGMSTAWTGSLDSSLNSHTSSTADRDQERAPPSSYIYQREDYDEGLHVYRQALTMPTTSSTGADNMYQQVVILRYNMGLIYIQYKQYNQARRWFQMAFQLLQQQQQTTTDSKLYIQVLHNLGYCSYCLGHNPEAMQFYRDALAVMDKDATAGAHATADSLDRAAAYNCIAVLLFHQSSAQENHTEEALALLQKSLATYHQVTTADSHSVGTTPSSPEIATCLGNMGRIHFLTCDHEAARKAFEQAYQIRKQVLGVESMDTAAMLFNLGQSLHYRGALEDALEAYREFLRVAQNHYLTTSTPTSTAESSQPQLPSHRDICAVQRAMAQVHRQQGRLPEACRLLRQAFEAGCGAVGALESEVSCILSELGSLYAERNDYTNAIDCFLHFLQTQEGVYKDTNPLHPNILITKINIARVYKHNSDYTSALRYYKEVHAMQVQILAKASENENNDSTVALPSVSSLEIASTLSSMGLMLYLLRAYKQALDCYQEALRVRLDKLGTSQHPDVAETINSIGLVLFKLGMMDMAKEAFHECIQLRTKLLLLQQNDSGTPTGGASTTISAAAKTSSSTSAATSTISSSSASKEIAVLLFNLATSCMQNGEEEQGIEYYCESLRIERRALGNEHPDVSMTLQHIARVHEERGDFPSAINYFAEALEVARKRAMTHEKEETTSSKSAAASSNQETIVRLLRVIGNLHFMLGQVPETMACFEEACVLSPLQPEEVVGVSRTGANFYGLSRLCPPSAPTA